ncbi:MAG: hypothetical protein ABIR63_02915 [Sphingomicrobium sp.]
MKRAVFVIIATFSSLICAWITWLPLSILFGKIPNPPAQQIARIALAFSLPTLLVSATIILTAVRFRADGRGWLGAGLLLIAPIAALATHFAAVGYIQP